MSPSLKGQNLRRNRLADVSQILILSSWESPHRTPLGELAALPRIPDHLRGPLPGQGKGGEDMRGELVSK